MTTVRGCINLTTGLFMSLSKGSVSLQLWQGTHLSKLILSQLDISVIAQINEDGSAPVYP